MKILAIGAHADDVEVGCGGSLLKWAAEGHDIVLHVATTSGYAAPDGRVIRSMADAEAEARASASRLGARLEIGAFPCFDLARAGAALDAVLVDLFERKKPDMVLTHWEGDTHSDHRALALATLHAARRVPSLLAYRSNHYPGARPFDPRVVVDISSTLEAKCDLIALFASENGRTRGAWLDQARAEARALGYGHGLSAAEGFEVIKHRI